MLLYAILLLTPLFVLWIYYGDTDLILLLYIVKRRLLKKAEQVSRLHGKVVWITGASAGIGEALAYIMARSGCKLVLSARREDELQRVKHKCMEIKATNDASLSKADCNRSILVLPFDMTAIGHHKQHVDKVVGRFGRVDVVVLNAGRSQRCNTQDTSFRVIQSLMELNFTSIVSLTKEILPHMVTSKSGMFVVTSSVSGKFGAAGAAAYSASKHALQGFFDSLRCEIAEHGIDVLTVCAGWVNTELVQNCFTDKPGELYGDVVKVDSSNVGKETASRLSPERCASLMSVAMEERLSEIWPSKPPLRYLLYLRQYLPSVCILLLTKVGNSTQKERDGEGGSSLNKKE